MKTKSWIIFLGDLAIAYNREVLRGVSHTLESQPELQRYAAFHAEVGELRRLDTRDVAGVLISGLSHPNDTLRRLARCRFPMVDVAGERHRPWLPYCVRADDEAVGHLAADHLLARGFRRFGFLGHAGHIGIALRQKGFTERIGGNGYSVKCFEGSAERIGRRWWPPGMFRWIRTVEKPAAVFCCNDLRASALLMACQQASIGVPEEIALLGVDDDDVYRLLRNPHLSSIQLQTHLIAEKGLAMLLSLSRGEAPPRKCVTVPPGSVIVRASSSMMAVEDVLVRKALTLIHARLSDRVSIKRVAADMGISRPTLEKHFFRALGRSPAAEIRRLQVERATTLLATTDLSMPDVARRSGYSSAQQFSVSFKRCTGAAPTDYRRLHSPRQRRDLGA